MQASLFPARIIHLDLASGFSGEPLTADGRAAYIVFWWRGVPLGHRQIPSDALPIPEAHLWNLALQTVAPSVGAYLLEHGFAAPLAEDPAVGAASAPPALQDLVALEDPLQRLDREAPGSTTESISVIVCTRDRPRSLDRCLRSLLRCSPAPGQILVVDNCPSRDETRRVVASHPRVQYVLEPKAGLDVARNTGIRHTHGRIVAFLDDDVTVHPDWVLRLAQCFSDSQVAAATGLVLPAELETEAQALFEEHWGFHRGYRVLTYDSRYFRRLEPWGVPAWQVGAGANMAFRREAFDLVGDFDVRLDVGAAGCSGDSELWYRLLAAGSTCRYDPRVTAFHFHRRETRALERQLYYYLRGHTAALLIQFAKHRHWGNLLRLFVLMPAYYAKLLIEGLRHGFSARHRFVLVEWAGCLSGVFFFVRNFRSPKSHQPGGGTA